MGNVTQMMGCLGSTTLSRELLLSRKFLILVNEKGVQNLNTLRAKNKTVRIFLPVL